uniref:Uncharacterized protein n=1 Tax=Octopus bimaculoides TaxID=37653 RepID=A0A0L8HME4_OCTBM
MVTKYNNELSYKNLKRDTLTVNFQLAVALILFSNNGLFGTTCYPMLLPFLCLEKWQ